MTAKESAYVARVRSLSCVLCDMLGQRQTTPTNVHHPREGQGMSQRADHFLSIALCQECHQGKLGIHGDRTLLRIAKVDEMDLLAATVERLQ